MKKKFLPLRGEFVLKSRRHIIEIIKIMKLIKMGGIRKSQSNRVGVIINLSYYGFS
jgi:hypothetical protein